MLIKIRLFILLTTFCLFKSYGQLSDLARIDYTIIPRNGSEGVEYNRFRALFNYPIKLKEEKQQYLFLGLDYSRINLRIDNDTPFDKSKLDDFQILDFNVSYTRLLKNDWRLGVRLKPGFSTNLTARRLSFEDVVLSADVVVIKEKDLSPTRKQRLILGVTYSENRGFPFPLPFISYYKKFHEKWSYNLGIPKSNLQYHFTQRHRLKATAELDGFTANIQDGIALDNALTNAETINLSLILSGLQYEYHFAKRVEFYARIHYLFTNNTRLRDDDRDTIFRLNNDSSLYLRTGIKLKI